MDRSNEKAILDAVDVDQNDIDLDAIGDELQSELEERFAELDFLQQEREHISNPDHLGETVMHVVWEQFMNQVAATAGEDFIKENNNLKLDLRDEAHIQTAENFEKQEYAAHNAYVDYKSRGEEYRSNFYTDSNSKPEAKQKQPQRYNETAKAWETYDNVDENWKKALQKNYRKPYEIDRSADQNKFGNKTINKDHQVADATIARDAEAGAYMTAGEKVKAANAEANLFDLDSAANQSKSDHDGEKWITHERTGKSGTGQANAAYFGIGEDAYIEQDKKAKDAWEQEKKRKEIENIAAGKKSQREEAFRIGGKALRTALMAILAALVKEMIGKLILWFKFAEKSLNTLLEYMEMAIRSFVEKLRDLLVSTTDAVITTIVTAIVGPVIGTIKKVCTLLKQGWKSLSEAVRYLRKPENRGKPLSDLLPQVGSIVVAGLSGIGAIALGEVIEKELIAFMPGLKTDIPILGSPANLIGMLMGAVVCGVIGAIAIFHINKHIAKQQKNDNLKSQIDQKNDILATQDRLLEVEIQNMSKVKSEATQKIAERHKMAAESICNSLSTISYEDDDDISEDLLAMKNHLESLLD